MSNVKKQVTEFLRACIDPERWETNPILQDYMTPETVTEIEQMLDTQAKRR